MAHTSHDKRKWLCGVLISATAATACVSCSQSEHSAYAPVPGDGWLYGDTITLMQGVPDSSCVVPADIAVALRHGNSYAYSNIWLSLTYTGADSTVTDTISITLADDFGNWHGQGMGMSYQRIDTVLRDTRIDLCRPIRISHIMRTDTLRGIEQVGVVILSKDNH